MRAMGFVPGAPVLVPELSGPRDTDVRAVRDAAVAVVADLAARCDRIEVLYAGPPAASGVGTYSGFGVDRRVRWDPRAHGQPDDAAGVGWLLAGWLREQACPQRALYPWTPQAGDSSDTGVGVLVVADGSLALTEKAPGGGTNPAEVQWTAAHRQALAAGDAGFLRDFVPPTFTDYPIWRQAGLLAAAATVDSATLRYADAPFGVGYTCALWELS